MEMMKIWKDWMQDILRNGSGQVPGICIGGGPYQDMIDVPEEWFIQTTHKTYFRCCVGNESGYTWISPKGWAANKDALKKAFEANWAAAESVEGWWAWDELVGKIEGELAELKKNNKRYRDKLASNLKDIKKAMLAFK